MFWVFKFFFVIRKSVHKHFCIFLKKQKEHACVVSPSFQKCPSAMLLKALPSPLFLVRRISLVVVRFAMSELFFLIFLSFLSLLLKNYSLTLLVISISSSILILLIFLILLWLFCRSLLFFNFIIESQFINYYIFQFDPYFLNLQFFFLAL